MPDQELSIQIKLERFEAIQFHQYDFPKDMQPMEKINFNHTINIRTLEEQQTIASRLDVKIFRESDNSDLAKLTTEAIFKLGEGFEKLKELGGIPEGLMLLVINLTYSTTRGIMIERFRGTPLQVAYLPIINPNQVLQQMIASIGKVNNHNALTSSSS